MRIGNIKKSSTIEFVTWYSSIVLLLMPIAEVCGMWPVHLALSFVGEAGLSGTIFSLASLYR